MNFSSKNRILHLKNLCQGLISRFSAEIKAHFFTLIPHHYGLHLLVKLLL